MKKLLIGLVVIILVVIIGAVGFYKYNLGSVSKDETIKNIEIKAGSTFLSIADTLKENNLIKSELVYKIYIKLNKPTGLVAGTYKLSEDMDLKNIIDILSEGTNDSGSSIKITFVEGKNMRYIIKTITDNTNNKEADVTSALNDKTYLNELIKKYWFITDEVKNSKLYYSLEGYLFPDTYEFKNKDVTVKEIFNSMIENMGKKLEPYKKTIEEKNYKVHNLLTLASIVEQEAGAKSDRKGVAGVFYNRLNNNYSLGSDVTTYYASKIELWSRDLTSAEINNCNDYNTRATCMVGELPIGPIGSVSASSFEATMNPTSHNYFYFVADKNGKTYFNKTYAEHNSTISKLKSQGLWYEYN